MTETERPKSFFDTFRGSVLSSIPALSVVTFVLVAVKVFRASGMETSTTVAIVSTADVVALLKGVVLTLLPGFIAGVIATSIWWWAKSLPTGEDIKRLSESGEQKQYRKALAAGEFGLAWAMVGVGFFTISWPIFLAFFLPFLSCSVWITGRAFGKWRSAKVEVWLRRLMRIFGAGAATVSIAYLSLAQTVWLPLRLIEVQPGHSLALNGKALPSTFGAYVLSQDKDGASLLLEEPRAVVQVGPDVIKVDPQICIPPPSSARRFFLRTSQIIGLEEDPGSPYQICP